MQDHVVAAAGPTLFYIPNFVTPKESEYLLKSVYSAPAAKWTVLRNRRLQNWGGIPMEKGMLQQPLPPWLQSLASRIDALGIIPRATNHVLINEYTPGQGIMPHTDGPLYTPVIANITLGAHTLLDLYDAHGQPRRCSVLLQPGSLLIMKDALYLSLHGIEERAEDVIDEHVANLAACPGVARGDVLRRGTRVSLTVRNVPKAKALPIFNRP